MRHITLNKAVGETPRMAIEAWRAAHPDYARIPLAYAGRLDPMASGKLLVLIGDECRRQSDYTSLDKAYEIEVLLDVGSDTGDVLGLTTAEMQETRPTTRRVKEILKAERGTHTRAYPAFSSKTVRGKPLFLHTLEGTLSASELPTHTEQIYSISLLGERSLTTTELRTHVTSMLDRVPRTTEPSKRLGEDFRVDAVREAWETTLAGADDRTFTALRLSVICASGTYMRSLAGRIGEALGTRGLALSITRTKVGKFVPFWRRGIWRKQY